MFHQTCPHYPRVQRPHTQLIPVNTPLPTEAFPNPQSSIAVAWPFLDSDNRRLWKEVRTFAVTVVSPWFSSHIALPFWTRRSTLHMHPPAFLNYEGEGEEKPNSPMSQAASRRSTLSPLMLFSSDSEVPFLTFDE